MIPDQWQKAKNLFDAAMKRPPDERLRFLDENFDGDEAVRREVASLLANAEDAAGFLEHPAVGEVAKAVVGSREKLRVSQSLSHYKIIKLLGAGGMGEVYLANDKKLDRQVAVKILNEKFAKHESNLQRFIQEAKAASALNHPNILVIHEIGESEDAHYIVSEFIKGKTLREILKEKTLNLSEVLDIAIQIVNALTAAHEAHIVHRDIKPENIMIRPDGYVKILDFGLAKLVEQKTVGFE
ncbi:MAG: serine/threonine protein kinase, partial [Acidobacteria bacterium]|nr:serine/threonine protein kinase [Acidobacteriota bacterium]